MYCIALSDSPTLCGEVCARTHERLVAGEVFRVSETFEGSDGTLCLDLHAMQYP